MTCKRIVNSILLWLATNWRAISYANQSHLYICHLHGAGPHNFFPFYFLQVERDLTVQYFYITIQNHSITIFYARYHYFFYLLVQSHLSIVGLELVANVTCEPHIRTCIACTATVTASCLARKKADWNILHCMHNHYRLHSHLSCAQQNKLKHLA